MMLPSRFPDPETADPKGRGLIAVGGDLSPELLIDAYSHGIFPWPCDEESPLMWYSLEPRMVLFPNRFRYSKSLRRVVESNRFEVRIDTCFEKVIRACAATPRAGQEGTWITEPMVEAYCALHNEGLAHSFETFLDGTLVGGLYGVSWGRIFCGESMFHTVRDASKVAFCKLVEYCLMHDIRLIDAQQPTRHLASLGGKPMARHDFLSRLPQLWPPLDVGIYRGRWRSHSVVLSLGGNEGDVAGTIAEALQRLKHLVGPLVSLSPLYESEPWGFDHTVPNFLNACAVFDTTLSPSQVLAIAMRVEKQLGRQRAAENSAAPPVKTGDHPSDTDCLDSSAGRSYSSRPIDIDILFYDSCVISASDLQVPHPRLHLRRFVLKPLADLMPDFMHPDVHRTVASLLDACPDTGAVWSRG